MSPLCLWSAPLSRFSLSKGQAGSSIAATRSACSCVAPKSAEQSGAPALGPGERRGGGSWSLGHTVAWDSHLSKPPLLPPLLSLPPERAVKHQSPPAFSRLDPQALHHHCDHNHSHHHGTRHHPEVHHSCCCHHRPRPAPRLRGPTQHQGGGSHEHQETHLHPPRHHPAEAHAPASRHQETPTALRLPPLPARWHLRGRWEGVHLQLPGRQRRSRLREKYVPLTLSILQLSAVRAG